MWRKWFQRPASAAPRRLWLECEVLESREVPTITACSCGQVTPRIVNGTPTSDFASVGLVGDRFEDFCSGTLIAPRYVLTAGHCAEGVGDTQGRFTIGGQTYSTSRVIVHPNYNPNQLGENGANDIGLFELSVAVTGITPSPINRLTPQVGQLLTLVGFGAGGTGSTGHNGDFGTKRVGTTPIDSVTSTLIEWRFDNNQESNTAPGDSGGPAFLQRDGVYYVAGVTSGGTRADAGIGDNSYDTRVDAYASWIDSIVGATTPPPPPPPPDGEDPGDEPAAAQFIEVSRYGSTFRQIIDPGSDIDFYQFVAPATGRLVIRANALDDLDPMLGVYNARGWRLRFNDDANFYTYNSRVRLDAVKGRTYLVAVESYRDSTGEYDLVFKAMTAPRSRLADLARFLRAATPQDHTRNVKIEPPKPIRTIANWTPTTEVAPSRNSAVHSKDPEPELLNQLFRRDWNNWLS